ncbi:PREDICTED: cysteine-rich venom protein 6-like [Dufourea novaeangliae]|uniref:cysteine-rich venom protein 6-like n=1 Tax=Dufourea novaeangliae TaxID=178035 RepID=UPI000767936F|nr:PREDICTED: cysteine-rich venom protein 6-like [Dufourea novaeangliae]
MSRFLILLFAIFAMMSISSAGRVCPPNSTWKSCASACPLTCENPKPRPCTLVSIM